MSKVFENVTYDELSIGQTASLKKTLTDEDIKSFAGVSGDINPAHLDKEYADHSMFHGVIAHGMFSGALISAVLGTKLPGPGSIYLNQSLQFKAPVRVGDTLEVTVKVLKKEDEKKIVELECLVTNQKQKTVVEGVAKVIAPTEKIKTKKPKMPQVLLADEDYIEVD